MLYEKLTYEIRGAFYEVYNTLGPGFKEEIYHRALAKEFRLRNISYVEKKRLTITYKDEKVGIYEPDFVVDEKVVIEIKSLLNMPKVFETQLYYYLKGTDYKLGFLVNFGAERLDIRRKIHETAKIRGFTRNNPRSSAMKSAAIRVLIGALLLLGNYEYAYCLNVSPGRIEINVAPGKGYEGVLMVKNTEKRDLEIKLCIEDWNKAVEGNADLRGYRTRINADKKGRGFTRIGTKKIDMFEWLRLNPLEFELKEGEMKEVSLKVRVPKEARGELNAMIFINGMPKEVQDGAIGIRTSIGIPIYVMVKGTEKFKAEVEELKLISASPLELAVRIKNLGNVHIRPGGTIEIKNKDGILLITVLLNEYNYPVLPNSSRTLEIRSNNRLEAGEYIANIKMGYQDKKYQKRAYLKIQ